MVFRAEFPCLQRLPDGSLLLRLHVQPRAAANDLAGLQGNMLKIRLTSPPVDGKANQAVIAYLAKLFHLPKAALTIKSGHQSRKKTVSITGTDSQRVCAVLAGLLPDEKQ
jgi:TIGR00251 family protein